MPVSNAIRAGLGQHLRHRGEGAVEQDDTGHRPAGLAARAHRDAQIGLLERLDPITGHGHDVRRDACPCHRGFGVITQALGKA